MYYTRFTLLVLTFFCYACSQNNKKTDENKVQLNYEYALNDPFGARIYTLSNGLKVYLSVNKSQPRINTMIAVKAGSKNDPAEATGLAHYLEHMLFKGTDKFGTKDFRKEKLEIDKIEALYETYRVTQDPEKRKNLYHQIDSISSVAAKYAIPNEYDKMIAAIGSSGNNAFTTFDQTVYVNEIPNNQLENWLKIEGERFRNPVLRLFHTELEAVYEEKNGSIDNDMENAFDLLMSGLFQKNNYGSQTTIGTIEHLKNPSLKEIRKFYDKWYVPNNMALIMSGDFEPDAAIQLIEKYLGNWKKKDFQPYSPAKEEPIQENIHKAYTGTDKEFLYIAFRSDGAGTKEGEMMNLMAMLLSNRNAGLFDVNLNQQQKVIDATAFHYVIKDYGLVGLSASPKAKQSLDDVEKLLLAELEKLKKGDFPDWLLGAVVNEMKLENAKLLEDNSRRTWEMMSAFVNEQSWQKTIERLDRLSKLTKKEVVDFANKFFSNHYVVVHKKQGKPEEKTKVVKPEITPIEVDRESVSAFTKSIYEAKVKDIEPVFVDFNKDMTSQDINSMIKLVYINNNENDLFEYTMNYQMGSGNNKIWPIVFDMMNFTGTDNLSSSEFKQELFKLGCTVEYYCGFDEAVIKLSGLNENFEAALALMESMLSKPKIEEQIFKNYKEDLIKQRDDDKKNKEMILKSGLLSYARYGKNNPFTYVYSNEEVKGLSLDDVLNSLESLKGIKHEIMFYGKQEYSKVLAKIKSIKEVPGISYKAPEKPVDMAFRTLSNEVYAVDFDMTQADIMIINEGKQFDIKELPVIHLYNSYFGDGMSAIVFQDLRESKALAYSAYSKYSYPHRADKPFYNKSFIGTQADKLSEALKGMNDLLTKMPYSELTFKAAKEHVLQEIRTNRFSRSRIYTAYVQARNFGINYDWRKDIFEKVQGMTYKNIEDFQKENISGKPGTILVVGKKSLLNQDVLNKYGSVKYLTAEELYGY
ncbi:MAG: M16 family metallopeptidase [Bacteroidia bacterium]